MVVTGASPQGMMVRSDIAGAQTPAELWNVVSAMMVAPDDIEVRATGLRSLQEEPSASADIIRLFGGKPAVGATKVAPKKAAGRR